MKTSNLEKFQNLVTGRDSDLIDEVNWRIENQDWLKKSGAIALKVLRTLHSTGISQKILAEKMDVSPQYINKIVKGQENLSLETIARLEKCLGVTLIEIPLYQSEVVIKEEDKKTVEVSTGRISYSEKTKQQVNSLNDTSEAGKVSFGAVGLSRYAMVA